MNLDVGNVCPLTPGRAIQDQDQRIIDVGVPDHKTSTTSDKDANQQQDQCDEKGTILSIPTATTQEEWSDPLLLERYEDEIIALEDYLQEQEQRDKQQNKTKTHSGENSIKQGGGTSLKHQSCSQKEGDKQGNLYNRSPEAAALMVDILNTRQKGEHEEDNCTTDIYDIPNLHSMDSLISLNDDSFDSSAVEEEKKRRNSPRPIADTLIVICSNRCNCNTNVIFVTITR